VYPNPFMEQTTISYALQKKSMVEVVIYNSLGQQLQTIVNENQPQGNYTYTFDAIKNGYTAGVYFVKITIDNKIILKRIMEL
jgi:hypothetical protein